MIVQKELTIKELCDELKVLRGRLIKLADKYNRSLISVSAITWKDVIAKGGNGGDIVLNKVIKQEDLENEFDVVKASFDSYKEEAIKKMREMIAAKPVEECIVYFRDTLHWQWEDIAKMFDRSRRQCIRLYNKAKK